MGDFFDAYMILSLITEPQYHKNLENSTWIDLHLTTYHCSLWNSFLFETGLLDLHIMTVTVMKASFQKLQLNIVSYRYNRHSKTTHIEKNCWRIKHKSQRKWRVIFKFLNICEKILNHHASCKQKYAWGNQLLFMNHFTFYLRNKYLKSRTD